MDVPTGSRGALRMPGSQRPAGRVLPIRRPLGCEPWLELTLVAIGFMAGLVTANPVRPAGPPRDPGRVVTDRGSGSSGCSPASRPAAGADAGLILDFSAARVFLVIGGEGTATVMEGEATREVAVSGAPTLNELRNGPAGRSRVGVHLDEGMSAYAFTFG